MRPRAGSAPPCRPSAIPSTSTSGPPIMKSVWIVEVLKPSSSSSASLLLGAVLDRVEDAGAVGDVAARVLVEQRVQEREPGAADARVAVDERDLAEHAGALVLAQLLADQLGAGARVHLDSAAALEAELEVADDVAGERQRHRRADDPLGASAVRAS